ncbi:MAG: aspartyl/asparaginyl beta-hydroxylase domain-containing protein [Proteobacteria bacterium]|nr:aspartyl/asparaginyl beta-hydroxylase domain-containing protein [Pseudomonadota bacterium]
MLLELVEKLIWRFDASSATAFFEPADFPWTATLQAQWLDIRAELDAVLRQREQIPNFQDVSADQRALTANDDWKTFFLYIYGHAIDDNCARCPATTRLVREIPGMKTAMFSILAPGKHIPEHRGPYKGVLRYHLGLRVPDGGDCRIRVKDDTRPWVEGGSLVFDDSHVHQAWNDAPAQRVVLFVDFLRPLPMPLALLNRLMVWRFSSRPFIMEAVRNARHFGLSPELD